MKRKVIKSLLIFMCLFFLTGCTSTPQLSKEEFISKFECVSKEEVVRDIKLTYTNTDHINDDGKILYIYKIEDSDLTVNLDYKNTNVMINAIVTIKNYENSTSYINSFNEKIIFKKEEINYLIPLINYEGKYEDTNDTELYRMYVNEFNNEIENYVYKFIVLGIGSILIAIYIYIFISYLNIHFKS